MLKKLEELGYDKKQFGLHSFRAGGATVAANDPTLPERLLKRHGRWSSDRAKDGHIKESIASRLHLINWGSPSDMASTLTKSPGERQSTTVLI